MNAWLKRCVFNLDLNRESVSEPRTLSGRLFQSLGAKYVKALPPLVRAGYSSKIFDIDTDTLSSIPVPERYFFRYQFYEISFNKITLSKKTLI